MKANSLSILKLFSLCLLILMSCKKDQSKQNTEAITIKIESNLSEIYAMGLYENYSNNPSLQVHKDENLIIDYILAGEEEFQRLPSGLYYYIDEQGKGDFYGNGQSCRTDYKGYFLNKQIFDSSYSRNTPLDFKVGQMNPAWNEILQIVNPGTRLKIIVPSRLAYGERGFPGYVPPNTVIAFDITTIKI